MYHTCLSIIFFFFIHHQTYNSCLSQVYIFLRWKVFISSKPWFGKIVCQHHHASWWIAMMDSISMIFTTLCKVQQEIRKIDETNVKCNLVNLKFWFWIYKPFDNKSRYFMWPMLAILKCQTLTNFHYNNQKKN